MAGLIAIVPLIVLAATSDWRHALFALRQYVKILGMLAALGGGFGLLMAFAEYGPFMLR